MQLFKFLLTIAPVVLAQDGLFDFPTIPWTGPVGVVPRLECSCDCGDPAASLTISKELCQQVIDTGRKKEVRLMEDGSCAFWGMDVTYMYQEMAGSWGKEICAEKGCNATSTCNYISCTGVQKTKIEALPEKGSRLL
ncbi:hypothetical protein ABW19_dt0207916 [Dactylella cylindrospora]|nr:hypothetical protein ABW19_dt0207916 [Dactylella cylindrospora]